MSLSVYSLDNAIETGSEVGKFFRVLNGERGNEEIMRKKRQHFPNLTDNDIITEDYFAAQHLTFIVGVLHQLKELSQCSQQTFNELLNETLKITDRINKVESRTIKCSDCFKKIEEQIEKKSQIFLQGNSIVDVALILSRQKSSKDQVCCSTIPLQYKHCTRRSPLNL